MFGFMKSPSPSTNTESDNKKPTITPARRTSSEPVLVKPKKSNYFDDDDDDDWAKPSSSSRTKNASKSNNGGPKDFDSMSVQELESHAVNRAEDTTKSVNNCLKIAEDIKQDATKTLDTLHQQGEQINRTHMMAVEMDRDLSKGEKLLNNLGGMFSMPWKPKKTREIKGPVMSNESNIKQSSAEQREKLGVAPIPRGRASRTPPSEPRNAMQQIELEKEKQDDGLSDLSNILGDLKGMAVDMGSELDRQNKALDHLSGDVDELNSRVKGANQRARRLVGK